EAAKSCLRLCSGALVELGHFRILLAVLFFILVQLSNISGRESSFGQSSVRWKFHPLQNQYHRNARGGAEGIVVGAPAEFPGSKTGAVPLEPRLHERPGNHWIK